MEARTQQKNGEREAIVVNRNLAVEISFDEILEDLLYPAGRIRQVRRASQNGRSR